MSTRQAVRTVDRTPLLARRWSAVAAVLGVVILALAAWAAYDTAHEVGDDPLAGLGYLLALALAVPGGVAVLLGGVALALSRRRPEPALTCAVLGALVGGGTVGTVLATLISR